MTYTPVKKETAVSTRPIRISIDKHTNHGRKPDGPQAWIVTPGNGESANASDVGSYMLAIRHDYSGEPDRVTREFWCHGQRYEVLTTEQFTDRMVEIDEHEDCGEDAAREMLDDQGFIHERMLRIALGGDPSVFDAMEAAWHAASQFIDFACSGI